MGAQKMFARVSRPTGALLNKSMSMKMVNVRGMAKVSMELIKELRANTGTGISDCKKALQESDGDLEAAYEYLRKKGLATAAKKAGRVAAEGLVAIHRLDDWAWGVHGRGELGDGLRG